MKIYIILINDYNSIYYIILFANFSPEQSVIYLM